MVEMRRNAGMSQFPGKSNMASVRPMMGQMRPPLKPQTQSRLRTMPAQLPSMPQFRTRMPQPPIQMRPPMKPLPAQTGAVMNEDADLKVWYERVSNCVNGYNRTANKLLSTSIANNPSEMADLNAWRMNVEKCAQNYNAARNQVVSKFGQSAVTSPAMNLQNVRRI